MKAPVGRRGLGLEDVRNRVIGRSRSAQASGEKNTSYDNNNAANSSGDNSPPYTQLFRRTPQSIFLAVCFEVQ